MTRRIATFVTGQKLLTGSEAKKAWATQSVRCACGYYGDESNTVSGSASDMPAEWLGCPNCNGQALGYPLVYRLPVQVKAKEAELRTHT